MAGHRCVAVLTILSKIVLHTGKELHHLGVLATDVSPRAAVRLG
ncbi:hypothetical protein ACFCZ1_04380 [Streptomyces sp. NPDC056224]